MNNDMKTGVWIAALTPLLFGLVVIVTLPLSLWNAFVATKLYTWFVIPLGAPKLNVWWMWGLLLFIPFIHRHDVTTNRTWKQQIRILAGEMIAATFVLVLGYFLKGHIG